MTSLPLRDTRVTFILLYLRACPQARKKWSWQGRCRSQAGDDNQSVAFIPHYFDLDPTASIELGKEKKTLFFQLLRFPRPEIYWGRWMGDLLPLPQFIARPARRRMDGEASLWLGVGDRTNQIYPHRPRNEQGTTSKLKAAVGRTTYFH